MAKKRQSYTDASIFGSPNSSQIAEINVAAADRILFWDVSARRWQQLTVGAGLAITGTTIDSTGAPSDAEYIVAAANSGLSAERVATNTATITWDFGTAGQAKANVVASTILEYSALITQAGTSAPTATVLTNTLGGTPTWARSSAGTYTLTLASVFTANKTMIFVGNELETAYDYSFVITDHTSTSVLTFITKDVDLAVPTIAATDDVFAGTSVKITVHP